MDSVGSFQSASLSADSEFGGNQWSKHTDKLQCFIRVVRVFRGSIELFRLRACLKMLFGVKTNSDGVRPSSGAAT